MKYFIFALVLSVLAVSWLSFTSNVGEQALKINFCWDSNGNHYVCEERDSYRDEEGVVFRNDLQAYNLYPKN